MSDFIEQLVVIVGQQGVLTNDSKTEYYRTGFRSGEGSAIAVVFPTTLQITPSAGYRSPTRAWCMSRRMILMTKSSQRGPVCLWLWCEDV